MLLLVEALIGRVAAGTHATHAFHVEHDMPESPSSSANPDPGRKDDLPVHLYPTLHRQLLDSLLHRRSLLQSTRLRLTSLQKRIESATTLSFNLVTQQDSMLMIQDSSSMKIIAAITMIFLPTTGVATVVGSQLFLSSLDEGADGSSIWRIQVSPLFAVLWWIAVPLTLVVIVLAYLWHWWNHQEGQSSRVVRVFKRANLKTLGTMSWSSAGT